MSEIPDFDAIGLGVLRELDRRLGSPQLARDLPGTLLMKVAESYLKYLEKKQELEERKLDGKKVDPMEMLDQPGLPILMRLEILQEYLDELEAVWRSASQKMMELREEAQKIVDAAQVP